MDVSIVITTYNRAESVRDLLHSLEHQSDRDFQVVIAIDGSTDGTDAMLARQKSSFDLKWIDTHCRQYGLAVARNRGILAADGDAVIILDDDSHPDEGFVAAHRSSVRRGVITGGPRNPSDPAAAPRMAWKMAELAKLPALKPLKIPELRRDYPTAYLIENNICLLRSDWIDMGLFSERLKMYGFIGQEFFARAEYLGMSYQYAPAAAVVHRGEMEGDNGFVRARKNRQAQLATLVRPSLMTPAHFRAQIDWAQAVAQNRRAPDMPPYRLNAALAAPYRLTRRAWSGARRSLVTALRGRRSILQ